MAESSSGQDVVVVVVVAERCVSSQKICDLSIIIFSARSCSAPVCFGSCLSMMFLYVKLLYFFCKKKSTFQFSPALPFFFF